MTTKKQPTSKSKPTTAPMTPRRPKDAPPQAFDIIPRSRVQPSINSRPVIASAHPPVADNTLTPATAPSLQLKHRALTILPPSSAEANTPDADPTQPAMTVDEPAAKPDKPEEPGVSVSDLLAKKAEKAQEAQKAEEAEKAEKAAAGEAKKADTQEDEKPAEGSLEAALKDDDAKPQEHSDALKEAMKELDDGDGRPHHELYGGKPVIVIHKGHGSTSALMWVLWFVICVGLALAIVDVLLDAQIITTDYKIPHTHFINK